METTQAQGQHIESGLFGMVLTTKDYNEGVNSYLEKRKPDWKNE
jgi:hypothetical protein